MGVIVTETTLDGGLTPICSSCGLALCWDISLEEYKEKPQFWEDWICKYCKKAERSEE